MKKIITIAAAMLLAAGAASTATAADTESPTYYGHLELSVSRTVDGQDQTGFIYLDCPGVANPAHPHRDEACTDLDAADGQMDRLPGKPGTRCADVHDPVTVTAHGTSQFRRVDWEHTYPNACTMFAATGNVFNF